MSEVRASLSVILGMSLVLATLGCRSTRVTTYEEPPQPVASPYSEYSVDPTAPMPLQPMPATPSTPSTPGMYLPPPPAPAAETSSYKDGESSVKTVSARKKLLPKMNW